MLDAVEFSLRRVGEENIHYYESEKESSVQLVFVPGGLNPELWKQQLRYFSKRFCTISFRPTVSFRDYKGEKSALENILNQDHLDNVVLISNTFGNSLMQEFEDRDDVVSTVLTGAKKEFDEMPPRRIYNWLYRIGNFKPKIVQKMFFSDDTEYKVVKEFMETVEKPDYSDFRSFLDEYRVSRPSKDSLVLHATEDRFSDIEFGKELEPNVSLSKLEAAGTFSFFEKPQDFNKALIDFLDIIEDYKEQEELMKLKENNRSLLEFEEDKSQRKVGKKAKKVKV